MLDGEGKGNRWEEVRMDQRGASRRKGVIQPGQGGEEPQGAHLALCLLPQL